MEQTRIEKAKVLRQQKSNERAQLENELRASYAAIKDTIAFKDILKKCEQYAEYHLRISRDGVGSRPTGQFDQSHNEIMEIVYHTGEKRLSELDRSVGITEIKEYIEAKVKAEALEPVQTKKIIS